MEEVQKDEKNQLLETQSVINEVFPTKQIQLINSSLPNNNPETLLSNIKNYQSLNIQQRLKIAQNIAVILQQIGEQGIGYLKSLFQQIIKDRDNISKALLSQLPQLNKMLANFDNYDSNIKEILIPVLITFLKFNELEIKEKAGQLLGLIAQKLNDSDRGDFILRHVIEMAHDDSNQNNRLVAVQLFSSMSSCFGKQLCEQFIGLQILSLGQDTSFKVRKQAIKHLPVISKLVSKQFFNRLFEFFKGKTTDQTNWAIRKACADIIIDMSEMCTKDQRQKTLTPIMLELLKDTNKWVKISAYSNLGKFIYTLKGQRINEKLLIQFLKMADKQVNQLGKDNEIIYNCAFNFPAVLNAVGSERWETDLWKVYEQLLKSTDKRIKITLSQSLHQIAKILGEKLTEKYLLGVVDNFFKDKNDQIKLGMIANISVIMSVLSQQKRQSLIGVFQQFQKDQKKWRIRQCIGQQLGRLLEIYRPQIIFEYVVPILFKFCSDSVSIVREEAAARVGDFITKFEKEDSIYLPAIIENVKGFGSSPKYTQRQTYYCYKARFVIMCKKLMYHKQLFLQNFMDIMVKLQQDKVVNVKMVLAQTVNSHLAQNGPLSSDERLLKLKDALQIDQDQEIRNIFVQK